MRGAYAAAVGGILVLCTLHTTSLPLLDPDEARFARTSVEMQRSGDRVVPTFEGEARLVKPPLVHWIQSALFDLLGVEPWVARLHAVAATLGTILLVGSVARRRFGDEGAFWSVAILGTMPLVLGVAHLGTLDALLMLHVTAFVALDLVSDDEPTHARAAALGALAGLAFLVKGPVGVVLPLLLVLAGRTASRRPVVPDLRTLLVATVAAFAVTAPWVLALIERVGLATAWDVVRAEALERYFAGEAHVEPPWFYAKIAAVGWLPWLAPVACALWNAARGPASPTARYLAAALAAGFVFFSLGASKLAVYVLPLAPLAALLVTAEIGRDLGDRSGRGSAAASVVATTIVLAIVLPLVGARLIGPQRNAAFLGAGIYAATALVAGLGFVLRRRRLVWGATAGGAAAFMVAAVALLLPDLARSRTSAYLIDTVPALREPRPIVTVDMRVPSLTLYLDRAPETVDRTHLADRLGRDDDALYVIDEADLPRVEAVLRSRLREIGAQGKYRVYERSSAAD